VVSINSTSYEGRGKEHPILTEGFFSFPLIPLPVKEATSGVRNTLD
jgi:hypothetical protein